ncbi:cuticle protein 38-like [Ochlerotatus camptorhynchus]|uniref:cuticle protein 38-like n=1 Tax=Ochlerotatus camptorhynchus TaxID=644619 RepID=UPI0031DFCAD4
MFSKLVIAACLAVAAAKPEPGLLGAPLAYNAAPLAYGAAPLAYAYGAAPLAYSTPLIQQGLLRTAYTQTVGRSYAPSVLTASAPVTTYAAPVAAAAPVFPQLAYAAPNNFVARAFAPAVIPAVGPAIARTPVVGPAVAARTPVVSPVAPAPAAPGSGVAAARLTAARAPFATYGVPAATVSASA